MRSIYNSFDSNREYGYGLRQSTELPYGSKVRYLKKRGSYVINYETGGSEDLANGTVGEVIGIRGGRKSIVDGENYPTFVRVFVYEHGILDKCVDLFLEDCEKV